MARMNKKGNAITNPMVILLILVVIGIFTFGFFKFSSELSLNDNNNLNDESIIYIAENNGFKINELNFSQNILTKEELENSFYAQEKNGTVSDKDYALEFLYYRGESVSWRGLVDSLYNLPAYTIRGLGLDLTSWAFVVNGLNMIIWAIIFFIVYKIIRGIIE
jgi:hypothetical protein